MSRKLLFGESIEVFDKIKREGTEKGNKGKRAIRNTVSKDILI
jgi:hypothetical protein